MDCGCREALVPLIVGLCLWSLGPVYGQGVLHGVITDSTGAAVSGAHVRVPDGGQGTVTDTTGRYRLSADPGRRVVLISAVGFATARKTVQLDASAERRLDVTLERRTLQGEEVVVTGTLRETYVKESPVKVNVVGAERLQRAKASANLMDLIGAVSGLSTQLNCGVCGTNAIRVNGVEGANTAVLIDGMPVMGALASVYGLNGISPSIIDRVEVIKGPQSTLYGTQALGGVVNIFTKDPANTPTFSADVYAKSTQESSVHLGASPEIGRVDGFVSGNALRMEHFIDDNGDGFADQPRRSRLALFAKATVAGTNGEERLNVGGKLYWENRTGGSRGFSDDLRGSRQTYGESIYTRRGELLTEFRPPGLDERLRLSGAFTYHDQDSYYGTEHYVGTQKIAFGQATWSQSIAESLRVLVGASVRYDVYDDNTPATTTEERRFIPGLFGQGEYTAGDVTLLGGLRVDHHAHHGMIPAPRLSAKYSPSERTTVRSSAGTGFRIVNVFTEDHAALTGSREVVFAETLDPERSRSVTASVEHIVPFDANPLTVSVDGFYTRFSNKIIPNYDRDPDLILYENLDGYSVTRGITMGVDQNFTALPLRYDASLTLLDVFTQDDGTRQSVTYSPNVLGDAGATYTLRSLDARVEYTGRLTGRKRMPDYYVETFDRDRWSPIHMTHDLKVTKKFLDVNGPTGVGLDAYFAVENVFDYVQGSPLVDANDPFGRDNEETPFDTIYTWGPMIGRTITIGVRMNLR